jgi:hypothetical protein
MCKIKSVTGGAGLTIRPSSAGSRTTLRGFTIDGTSNTQATGNQPGLLIQRKVYMDDVVV